MAARTLVQALEGVSFPCDRAQLIDYARRNNLGGRTLAALEEIPEGQYRDLSEVFTALPGRPQAAEPERPPQAEQEQEPEQEQEEMPPLPMAMEWWLAGWRQMMMPWEVTAHCLRGSAESWPQWLRLSRHLLFPWSK
jgi:hypothetical protein